MDIFIKEAISVLNPTNFPMFVAIYLLVKVTGSIDKLAKIVEDNTREMRSIFKRLDDLFVYLEYGIVTKTTLDRVSKFSVREREKAMEDDKNLT